MPLSLNVCFWKLHNFKVVVFSLCCDFCGSSNLSVIYHFGSGGPFEQSTLPCEHAVELRASVLQSLMLAASSIQKAKSVGNPDDLCPARHIFFKTLGAASTS